MVAVFFKNGVLAGDWAALLKAEYSIHPTPLPHSGGGLGLVASAGVGPGQDLDDALDAAGREHVAAWEAADHLLAHRQSAEDRWPRAVLVWIPPTRAGTQAPMHALTTSEDVFVRKFCRDFSCAVSLIFFCFTSSGKNTALNQKMKSH